MSFDKYLNGFYDVEVQLDSYIKLRASKYFLQEENEKNSIHNVQLLQERKKKIKSCFLGSIGGLDINKTDIHASCTGIINNDNYVVKKIIYQSQPGIYVTSNLYLPYDLKSKTPAILFVCGHSLYGKACPAYQKVCIDLVNNGFVVLSVDPIGQGERLSYIDRQTGEIIVEGNTIEHTYTGLQCTLTGTSIARYFIWDLIRAIDYLCTLPGVDESRIGITGNSGGGTQTSYMLIVEDRIKAATVNCCTTSRLERMFTGRANDGEQNIYGAISDGINYDDFYSYFAPKPLLIGGVKSDFFEIEGLEKTYKRVEKTYQLFNSGHNVDLLVTEGMHGFNDRLREGTVNWFLKHLKGEEKYFKTQENIEILDRTVLNCTKSGNVMMEYSNACSIFDINLAYYKKNCCNIKTDKKSIEKEIKHFLNMPKTNTKLNPRIMPEHIIDELVYNDIFFFSEEGIIVDGVHLKKVNCASSKVCTIVILDEGTKESYIKQDIVKKALDEGSVFIFDPRGIGTVKSRCVNRRDYNSMFGTEYKLNMDAAMIKTSLISLRVYDILRACEFIKVFAPNSDVKLAGKGFASIYALLAGILCDEVKSIYLEDIFSFKDIIKNRLYKYDPRIEMYGVLKVFDTDVLINSFMDTKSIKYINSFYSSS